MLLTILRSETNLDRCSVAEIGNGFARGAETNTDLIHTHFDVENYPGESPHARVSIGWNDVEALIKQFSNRGHQIARRLILAERLAGAIEELTKENTN